LLPWFNDIPEIIEITVQNRMKQAQIMPKKLRKKKVRRILRDSFLDQASNKKYKKLLEVIL